jgi:hypothetical protein
MSSAALAKKRRAAPLTPQQPVTNTQQQSNQLSSPKITVQQALAILDSRLAKLEKMPLDTSNTVVKDSDDENLQLKELVTEYENRFELLVNEINNLKDTVFKLQTFTMEVNKDMYEKIKNPEKDGLDVVHEQTVDTLETDDNTQNEEVQENITFS